MTRSKNVTLKPLAQHRANSTQHQPKSASTCTPIVADTGATAHFFQNTRNDFVHTSIPLINITPTHNGITVLLPNQATMLSTHTGQLDIPDLPLQARQTHIFPHLASGSLLSIGQLCDAGCQATFDKQKLRIYYNKKLIMQGTRQPNKLWTIDNNRYHSLNSVIDAPTMAERITFLHKSLFSPTLSTLAKAIQAGYLTTFPPITVKQLRRWPPDLTATLKGHMHAKRANIQSTQAKANAMASLPQTQQPHLIPPDTPQTQQKHTTTLQTIPTSNKRTHHIYAACEPVTGAIYTDQTGHFTVPSASGNKYIFVCYDYDSNYIDARPLTGKTKEQIVKAYQASIKMLQSRGLHPQLQRLDNEASQALIHEINKNNIDFQLTPAGLHRRNKAERAIQTFKNHFIAGLCSIDPAFPLNLWDKLIPQAILTLNLLRASRINPNLSAYAQLHGNFNYNRTPLAPPGIKVLTYIRPENRKSWAPHAKEGFYLGPAMNHYRCHKVWSKATNRTSIVDTLKWLPHRFRMPTANREGLIVAAAHDLCKALLSTTDDRLHTPLDAETRKQLQNLQEIFANKVPQAITPVTKPQAPTELHTTAPLPRVTPTLPAPLPRVPLTSQPQSIPTALPRVPPTRTAAITTTTTTTNDIHRSSRTPRPNTRFFNDHTVNAVLNPATGELEEYRHLINGKNAKEWLRGNAKEIARLCQGRKDNTYRGTNTIIFKHPREKPPQAQPTYLRVVAAYRPSKQDPYRIRWTVGGNRINYEGDKYTPNAELTTVKLLLNSVISTKKSKFMTIDLKDFYLNTPLTKNEYMWVQEHMLPQEIIDEYNLRPRIHNGRILAEIRKSMYGLPQAGRISYDALLPHLLQGGYQPTPFTPGLFRHKTKPVTFCLIVDDFGIKYENEQDVRDLITHLQKKYQTTVDWTGQHFCGMHLKWDYHKRTVELSLPGYINKALQRFRHPPPPRPEHSPHPWLPPNYGKTPQLAPTTTNTPLAPTDRKWVQEFLGTFLYYARTIDNTMLPAISSIAAAVSTSSIADIRTRINHFLNYAATHPNATLKYTASAMHLWAHSDASYLCEPKFKSRAGAYIYLSSKPTIPITANSPAPPHNNAIHVVCKLIDAVMSSAQEAETGAGYITAKELAPLRQTLQELGHPQGPTPIQFDNKCATGILTDSIK